MNTQLIFIHALSPLHAGTGQGVGVIDLPIAREKATGLPFLPGSSLKGSLRSLCPKEKLAQVFGAEVGLSDEYAASSVQFSDQRLLLFPVRSLAGTFAWVTCPYVLRRLARDIADTGIQGLPTKVPRIANVAGCLVANPQTSKITLENTTKVYLEDLDFTVQAGGAEDVATWAKWIGEQVFPADSDWGQMLAERICIVHDDVFSFLVETATEITARIKLKEDSKTVQDGGLWYEEALPAETILTGLALFSPLPASKLTVKETQKIIQDITKQVIQFGGKATVGRGLCHVQMTQEGL